MYNSSAPGFASTAGARYRDSPLPGRLSIGRASTLNEARKSPVAIASAAHLDPRGANCRRLLGRMETVDVAQTLYPGVRVITEKPAAAKASALMTGFEAATGDIIVMLDADGSMDPEEIVLFVAALMSGADFVKGSRFIQGAGTVDMTFIRMFGNWALTLAVRMLYGGSFSTTSATVTLAFGNGITSHSLDRIAPASKLKRC